MRAVFDTNVLFAALITQGVCVKLLRRARLGDFELVTGDDDLLSLTKFGNISIVPPREFELLFAD